MILPRLSTYACTHLYAHSGACANLTCMRALFPNCFPDPQGSNHQNTAITLVMTVFCSFLYQASHCPSLCSASQLETERERESGTSACHLSQAWDTPGWGVVAVEGGAVDRENPWSGQGLEDWCYYSSGHGSLHIFHGRSRSVFSQPLAGLKDLGRAW